MRVQPGPEHGNLDADTLVLFSRWDEPTGCKVLEVGANEEPSASILAAAGYSVVGVDLRPPDEPSLHRGYQRWEGDFVELAPVLKLFHPEGFRAAFSTSALEHFGLGTYGEKAVDPDLDCKASDAVRSLLAPGGSFRVTVPYGAEHVADNRDWRVYCRGSLRDRIVRDFRVEERVFFKSADCDVPDGGERPVPLVREGDADGYRGKLPHLTVYLLLRKT